MRRREAPIERALIVHDVGESQLLPLMNENVERYPHVKLFSLPSMPVDGRRRLELGVRGPRAEVDRAFEHLRNGVAAAGFAAEPAES
jgi:hypothetical protein